MSQSNSEKNPTLNKRLGLGDNWYRIYVPHGLVSEETDDLNIIFSRNISRIFYIYFRTSVLLELHNTRLFN